MADGTEPIADEELLYRRVPASTGWYSPENGNLSDQAFAVHKLHDATGLSVSRDKYCSSQQAARGRAGKSYYVAVLRASDLKAKGIKVVPRPQPGDPGARRVAGLEFRKSQGE